MFSIRKKIMILAMLTEVLLLVASSAVLAQTKQENVHHMSHIVMPFDMSKTIHIFKMTELGGIQKVLVRDSNNSDQILLIRQHLSHEAEMFKQGNYSDPAKLHGSEMPGLAELRANPFLVKISYMELPEGAQITFESKNLTILTAIHRWFGAQLSEHGADAKAE